MENIYRASDGKEFTSPSECEKHEEALSVKEALGGLLIIACIALMFFFL